MITLSNDLQIDPAAIVGKSIAILGIKGSGKSNTARCLIEDLLADVPLTIVDPEGEYASLRTIAPILHVGKRGDLSVPIEQVGMLGRFAYLHKLSVILDLKGLPLDEMAEYVEAYLRGLWRAADETNAGYFIVLEEARLFAPQGSKATPLLKLLQDIQFRGRKRGVGMVVVNQRTATLDKNVLDQCEIMLLHKVAHDTDIKTYQKQVPGMTAAQIADTARNLLPGQIVFVNGGESCVTQVRLPRSNHGGATPLLGGSAVRGIDAALLDDLRKALTSPLPLSDFREGDTPTPSSPVAHLATAPDKRDELIAQLRAELAEARAEIERLKALPLTPAPSPTKGEGNQLIPIGERLQQAAIPIAATVMAEKRGSSYGAIIDEVDLRAQKREEKYGETVIRRQTVAFNNLLLQWRAMAVRYRDLLRVLDQCAPEEKDSRTLAHNLGLRADSLDKHSPTTLLHLGLIRRRKEGKRWLYHSNARAMLAERFPALETDELINQLLGVK